jgi:hypothetical protein
MANARKAPEVARGARGAFVPEAGSQVLDPAARKAPVSSAPARKEGFRRYKSKYDGYRLPVTMPDSYRDQVTGRKVEQKGKSAVFREGYFETDDPETIAVLDRACVRYPQDLWDLDVADANQRSQAANELVNLVKGSSDPDVRAKVLEALGVKVAEEFDLPKKEETKTNSES